MSQKIGDCGYMWVSLDWGWEHVVGACRVVGVGVVGLMRVHGVSGLPREKLHQFF